jgi:hypothetical protein
MVTLNETESEEFYIQAVDPDGDVLLYRWKLDKNTVSDDEYYLFETDYDSKRVYNLTVTVQDVAAGSSIVTFAWEIFVNNNNRLPTMTVIEPITKNPKVAVDQSLKFSVSAEDPDKEDDLIIKWYFDDVDSGQTGSSYAYLGKSADLGRHEVKVEVTDGFGSVDYSWNITVSKKATEAREEIAGLSVDMWGLILAVISAIAAIMMFLLGFIRMNKKKGRLKQYMDEIESIMDSEKSARGKELELKELMRKIKNEFSEGMIIENHYLILEREVNNAVGDIRTEVATSGVALSGELKGDVEHILEDGRVTSEEYQSIINKIRANKNLNPAEKNKLNSLMTRWMIEGKRDEGPQFKSIRPKSGKSKGPDFTQDDDATGNSLEEDEDWDDEDDELP